MIHLVECNRTNVAGHVISGKFRKHPCLYMEVLYPGVEPLAKNLSVVFCFVAVYATTLINRSHGPN